jgi:hypothetical protein
MKEQLGCPREASLGERDAPESAIGRRSDPFIEDRR